MLQRARFVLSASKGILNNAVTTKSYLKGSAQNAAHTKKSFNKERIHRNEFREILGNEILYGRSVCNIALKASKRAIFKLYLLKAWETTEPDDNRVGNTMELANTRGIPIAYCSRHNLSKMSSNRPHQGVCLEVAELPYINLREELCQAMARRCMREEKPPLWIMLCGILDPMNLGAILRSCLFFNVDKILVTGDCAPMTPIVSKASSGAAEILKVYSTDCPKNVIQTLIREDWDVIGTAAEYEKHSNKKPVVEDIGNTRIEKPSLLIIGNEGFGIPIQLLDLCTRTITIIPGYSDGAKGDSTLTCLVGSLNVSTATAIILHQLQKH